MVKVLSLVFVLLCSVSTGFASSMFEMRLVSGSSSVTLLPNPGPQVNPLALHYTNVQVGDWTIANAFGERHAEMGFDVFATPNNNHAAPLTVIFSATDFAGSYLDGLAQFFRQPATGFSGQFNAYYDAGNNLFAETTEFWSYQPGACGSRCAEAFGPPLIDCPNHLSSCVGGPVVEPGTGAFFSLTEQWTITEGLSPNFVDVAGHLGVPEPPTLSLLLVGLIATLAGSSVISRSATTGRLQTAARIESR